MAILTVSDHIRTNTQTIAVEYETTFNGMIKNSLESIVREYTKINE